MQLLALLCLFVQGAWATDTAAFGGGDGSAKTPYIISSTAHWDQLAADVAAGTDYDGKYFQLDADITVTSMLGTGSTAKNARPFKGTFDGSGHTLTFNHTSAASEGDIAPFRFLSNATIENLHVDGIINTANRHTGGLAGRTYRTTLIQNCRVSTTIISSVSGDGTHGGIVALKPNYTNAHLTIDGCVFDGKILTTNGTTLCAGLVGYTSYGSLTIKNSLYTPATTADGETAVSDGATLYRYDGSHQGTITLTNAYYTQTLGTAQGKQAYSITFPENWVINIVSTGAATEYDVSGITAFEGSPCLKYNGTAYAGGGDNLTLKFVHHYMGATLGYNKGDAFGYETLPGNDTDGYTLTMPAANLVLGIQYTGPSPVHLPGSGTQDSPYEIGESKAWDYIASLVNHGNQEFISAHYKLTADISVTTMMGNNYFPFTGRFDGNGHTMTVSYNSDEQYTAPFRYVQKAEISNLHVDGTITTSKKFASGLIGYSKGATIRNCLVSVNMTSSINGDGSHGGIVAHNISGALTITGSAFDGYMLGGKTTNCGGFVGWNETNNSGTTTITDCLFIPHGTAMVIEKTFARSRSYDKVNITNSYCITDYNDDQKVRVYRITAGDNVEMTYGGGTATADYSVSGIAVYDTGCLKFGDILLAQNGFEMPLSLSHSGTPPEEYYTFKGFAATKGTLTEPTTAGAPYTLTMANADASIYATYNLNEVAWSGKGSGTEDAPYLISSSDDWDKFVSYVNAGLRNYATACYQLNANITVTTMVGTEGYPFSGHFDGNGNKYKLTLSYGTEDKRISENYCAPFRYVNGADIYDLVVEGSINVNNKFAAGIAAYADGPNTIKDCRVSATIFSGIRGDGTHGGFVANIQGGATTITGCAFNGRLRSSYTFSCGGFVGWVESNNGAKVVLENCLFAPDVLAMVTSGCCTFVRARSYIEENVALANCYYTETFGTIQGTLVYDSEFDDFPTRKNTIAGVDYYVRIQLIDNVAIAGITPFAATLGWTGESESYKVRYRVNTDIEPSYFADFSSGIPSEWTMIDADGDGHVWELMTDMSNSHVEKYVISYSYDGEALTPDNWLISPQINLGGMLKVRLMAADSEYPDEHFAIYLSTDGNAKENFTVTLVPETVSTGEWQEFTADLSAYSGQGYVAIRHFNCEDQWALQVDDFGIYSEGNLAWTEQEAGSNGATLTNLTPKTDYEYQVVYTYNGKTYYTPSAYFTTQDENVAPADVAVSNVTSNTATLSWTAYSEGYNLRYCSVTGNYAQVTLDVPEDVWGDGTGYQMLLDPDNKAFGTLFFENHQLANDNGNYSAAYNGFTYKIPADADGYLNTTHFVSKNSVTITIPAGTYDCCIANPTPGDRVYIVSNGMYDDFVFEPGKHYTFTVRLNEYNDEVQTTEALMPETGGNASEWTEVNGIVGTSYTLSDLAASSIYMVKVQSVKGEVTSTWSSTLFTTADATSIGLADRADNGSVITDNAGQQRNVTLVDRTLYKDGDWNTLCLPFALTADQIAVSQLNGADIRTLSTASFSDGELTLNFTPETGDGAVTSIEAGVPYLVRWNGDGSGNIVNPTFEGVTLMDGLSPVEVEGLITFTGTYQPYNQANRSILYLGSGNRLYYPESGAFIGAQRAYFKLAEGYIAGTPDGQAGIRAFVLNFLDGQSGQGEQTGINEVGGQPGCDLQSDGWYSLDGRRFSAKPSVPGVYVKNGRKTVIK